MYQQLLPFPFQKKNYWSSLPLLTLPMGWINDGAVASTLITRIKVTPRGDRAIRQKKLEFMESACYPTLDHWTRIWKELYFNHIFEALYFRLLCYSSFTGGPTNTLLTKSPVPGGSGKGSKWVKHRLHQPLVGDSELRISQYSFSTSFHLVPVIR